MLHTDRQGRSRVRLSVRLTCTHWKWVTCQSVVSSALMLILEPAQGLPPGKKKATLFSQLKTTLKIITFIKQTKVATMWHAIPCVMYHKLISESEKHVKCMCTLHLTIKLQDMWPGLWNKMLKRDHSAWKNGISLLRQRIFLMFERKTEPWKNRTNVKRRNVLKVKPCFSCLGASTDL